MRINCKYLIIILLALLCSCKEKPQQTVSVPKDQMKNSMEIANRYVVNEEEQDIKNYIVRHGMAMDSTGTGLRYKILKQGSDELLENGMRVSLEYQVSSIAGDVYYSSENDGIKTFVIGSGQVESGLEEAMTHFHKGDYGKVIIPSHLGFGLHGDDNRIPGYATLVYTIKIIDNK